MPEAERIRVVVCMGSSCFARGNNRALRLLQELVRREGCEDRVELTGSLCENSCTCGPTISINGVRYSDATPETCLKLVQKLLNGELAEPGGMQTTITGKQRS